MLVSWAIFAVEDFTQLKGYLRAMFGMASGGGMDGNFLYSLASYLPILIIAAVASTPAAVTLWKKLPRKAVAVLCPILILLGLLVSTAYLVDASYNPFLYFRF